MGVRAAKCPKCGHRLEYEAGELDRVQCPQCGASLRTPDPLLGKTLGDFEIIELLGRGGMGVVYRAEQISLARPVALKVLPRRLSTDRRFSVRFEREARAAAALSHPNIVQIHSVGEAEGRRYIAMEFVDGESLRQTLKRDGALDQDRALQIMKEVTAALARAFDAGIAHRDIKPSNILLTAHGEAKVADFGLAKRADEDVSVTATGTSVGTPRYMPPEAARAKELDHRSDLYSLGATFYHLLAGRPVFEGATTPELIVQHATERPTPLAQAARHVDRRLARIIDKLLRKNPKARHANAHELLAELEALGPLASAVDQSAPTLEHPARKGTRRRRRAPGDTSRAAATPAARTPAPRQRKGTPRGTRPKAGLLVAGGVAAALVLVIVLLLLFVLPGKRGAPAQARAPVSPSSSGTTGTGSSEASEPSLPVGSPESIARRCFDYAQQHAQRKDWARAKKYLDLLATTYKGTRFATDRAAFIAALRAQVETALQTESQPEPKTTPEPPKPEPPKPELPKPEPTKPAPPKPEPQAVTWKVYTQWPFDAAEAKRRQEETAKALGVPVEQDIDLGKGVKLTMVLIPAGEFMMGEDDAKGYHRVRISRPFRLGKYEMTREQVKRVVAVPGGTELSKDPMTFSSWSEWQKFATLLEQKTGRRGFRMPTEAEWEFACRAGSASRFHFGDSHKQLDDYAWWGGSAGKLRTHPVGGKLPNPWGLHDMHGNVFEWCYDAFRAYPTQPQADPRVSGGNSKRVVRGGCFRSSSVECRSGSRGAAEMFTYCDRFGFRIAQSIELDRAAAPKPAVPAPEPKADADGVEKPQADYASLSDKVWALFKERKYDEAGKIIEVLAEKPELKLAAERVQADREALGVLNQFWGTVEKSMAKTLKGRFVIIAGAGGTITKIEKGTASIKTPDGKTVTRSLTQLNTTQAATFSGLQEAADERSSRLLGVFLLAEGAPASETRKALANAGEGSLIAVCRERLLAASKAEATADAAAREAAAKEAWSRIESLAKGTLNYVAAKRLERALASFGKEHGRTRFHAGLAKAIAELGDRIKKATAHEIYSAWPFSSAEAKRRQEETARTLGVPMELELDAGGRQILTLVLIPAGEFMMGSKVSAINICRRWPWSGARTEVHNREHPRHRVRLTAPFHIGVTEVTRGQFARFVGETTYRTSAEKAGKAYAFNGTETTYVKGVNWRRPGFDQGDDHPVTCVSWNDARAFCKWLSKKIDMTVNLPTEAQWEYACRAGSEGLWPWGDREGGAKGWANIRDEDVNWVPRFSGVRDGYTMSTAPVGRFAANAFGLKDTIGNAQEWCLDRFSARYYRQAPSNDPAGPRSGTGRVIRGGSWFDGPNYARASARTWQGDCYTGNEYGFRIVVDIAGDRSK